MITKKRYQSVDVMRGVAILLMVVYHFCYDLSYFKMADFDFFNDPFWLHSRTFILSLFLALVGVSMWLAHHERIRWDKALRRAGIITVNAGLISLATWLIFGDRMVFFGVLHFIAMASLFGLVFVRYRWVSLFIGVSLLVLNTNQSVWFDKAWLQWIGMMTHKPATEDYVPMIPWFSVVLIGIFLAYWVPALNTRFRASGLKLEPVAFLGRHSLLIYMLHQPVLIGTLKLFTFR